MKVHYSISFNCFSTFFAGRSLCKEVTFVSNQDYRNLTTLNNERNKRYLQKMASSETYNLKPLEQKQIHKQ